MLVTDIYFLTPSLSKRNEVIQVRRSTPCFSQTAEGRKNSKQNSFTKNKVEERKLFHPQLCFAAAMAESTLTLKHADHP